MLVKVFDQGRWNRIDLHADGTWNGNYCRNPMDYQHLPEAHKLVNGGPVVVHGGKHYTPRYGPNVFD